MKPSESYGGVVLEEPMQLVSGVLPVPFMKYWKS